MATTTPPAPVSTFAPLRVPAYRRLWLASVVSNLGSFLLLVAAPWLMPVSYTHLTLPTIYSV